MELPAHPVYLRTSVPLPTGLDPLWSTASASSSPTPTSTGLWLKGLSRTGAPTPPGCGWGAATDCRNSQWTVRGSNPCPENSLCHGALRISQILLCQSRNKSVIKWNHWTLIQAIQTFSPLVLDGLRDYSLLRCYSILRCYSKLNCYSKSGVIQYQIIRKRSGNCLPQLQPSRAKQTFSFFSQCAASQRKEWPGTLGISCQTPVQLKFCQSKTSS